MTGQYNPKAYWENRLRNDFSARGVGHIGFSDAYNRWLYRRKRSCIEAALRGVSLRGKDVLDVGCGTGFFVEWYLAKGARIYGIDLTDVSIQRLQQQFDGKFKVQDVSDPAFDPFDKKFDVVNIWDVFYHIVSDDAFDSALENIQKSINKNGLLLFTDFVGQDGDVLIADHVKARCFGTYSAMLTARGFSFKENLPLYRLLNNSHLGNLDNYLGPLYFLLDSFARKISERNLSLSVWQFGA
jgi:2-polyprenyl-3-methyl-5-hydroxy-6-metoxy-1,4-benzoquinol methylase